MEYRTANTSDIPAIAGLALDAFAPSVFHFCGQPLVNRKPILDILTFIRKAEPGCFFVTCDGSEIAGYLIAPRSMRSFWLKAILHGEVFAWFFRLITGRYGLNPAIITKLARHKLLFVFSRHNYRSSAQGQILSISVHPAYRGRGIARQLMQNGLEYLQNTDEVKLEVRPQNEPALRLYTSLGFQSSGQTSDSQGTWLVMTKKMKTPEKP